MNTARHHSPPGRRALSTKKKLLFSATVFSLFLVVLYTGTLVWRSHRLYSLLKENRRGWKTQIHRPDPLLGFRPIPSITSAELFPTGPEVPTRIDPDGFRVPVDAESKRASDGTGPLVLALGCSFTFAAACPAEDAFAFRVAQQLDGRCINAGVCSYGLAQMLLQARQLIARYQPDIVLVQYSPWLVDRALSSYAPTYFGKQPVPYFSDDDGELKIQPPAFAPSTIDPREYDQTPRTLGDYLAFTSKAGLPLLWHDDRLALRTALQQLFGLRPAPTDRRQAVVDMVYGEIAQLCHQANAQMVIVILDKVVPKGQRESLGAAPDSLIADAHAALVARLPDGPIPYRTMMFQQQYGHWRGDPPVMVDDHPNQLAHAIITDVILAALAAAARRADCSQSPRSIQSISALASFSS